MSTVSRTRTEEIRVRLADDIVRGRLAPGVPLEEGELARQFGVSRTPVREAIRQLEAIGLAVARPHRGAVVAAVTVERLNEMFQVMGELEGICARECAAHMTEAERADLVKLHDALGGAKDSIALDAYADLNNRFHRTVNTGCHNAYLAETTEALRVRLAPYRMAQFHASLRRPADSWAEHDRVVRAILARDGTAAAEAMRAHIGNSHMSYGAVAPRWVVGLD